MDLNISKDILIFFQDMKQFFIKKGKKETIENYFRKFLISRATLNKTNFYDVLTKYETLLETSLLAYFKKDEVESPNDENVFYPSTGMWHQQKVCNISSQSDTDCDSDSR